MITNHRGREKLHGKEKKKKKSKISVPDISKILICLIPLISAELHDFTPASKLVSSFFFFNLSSDEL